MIPVDQKDPYIAWFPPGLGGTRVRELIAQYPKDPHRAAAIGWEEYAATLTASGALSVQTGAQSVTYGKHGAGGAAFERANWHLARARVYSVPVGPKMEYGNLEVDADTGDVTGTVTKVDPL